MANGRVDFREFQQFQQRFQQMLDQNTMDDFIRECILDLAKKLIGKVKRKTPVNTGLLRNSWKIGEVKRNGDNYEVEVYTDSEYATFIEKGFRAHWVPGEWVGNQFVYDPNATTGMQVGKPGGYVKGKFMLAFSEKEIEREIPKFLQRKQTELLKRIMEGR